MFTEDGSPEEITDAVKDAGLNYLWDILSALREEDSSLDDWISLNRGQLGLDPTFEFEGSGLIEVHSTDPDLDKNLVLRSIESMVLDKLGETWDEMYIRLKEFRDKNGHMVVPHNSADEQVHRLHVWVKNQRTQYKRGTLRKSRIDRLNALKFKWAIQRSNEQVINELLDLLNAHIEAGHEVNVKETEKDHTLLYRKIKHIRERYRKGTLSDSDVKPLQDIGLKIEFLDEVNEAKLKTIAEFIQTYPGKRPKTGSVAGNHIIYYRKRYRQGKLDPHIAKRLVDLGVSLDNQRDYDTIFNTNLEKYKSAVEQKVRLKHDHPLRTWIKNLRLKHEKDELTQAQLSQLSHVGIELV